MVGRYGDVFGAARTLCSGAALSNVRVNRTAAAGRLGPDWENVLRTPGRAKTARRSGSGGSTRG